MKLHRVIVKGRGVRGTFARLLELTDARPVPVEGATWIQIAAEGVYKGHPTGPFELNREVFDKLAENFRLHPAYELDPATGLGKADVIAFDFAHASEEPPSLQGVRGAPAQAWAIEVEVRDGDNGAEFWALTNWLEPARSYVQAGKYKWTSVAIWPGAVHPQSGEDIGWYMSSIAFTNDPFIQGMTPIAAKRQGLNVNCGIDWVAEELKFILGLPITASLDEVLAALAPLRSAAAPGGQPPLGVDVESLVGSLRSLLQLPLLAPADSVFAEVDKLLGLIAADPPAPVTQIPSAQEVTAATAARKEDDHMWKELIRKLARAAGISFDESDLAEEVKLQVLAERASGVILAQMEDSDKATKALGAIAKALGVGDPDAAVTALTEMLASVNEIKTAMPSLAAIMDGQITAQTEEEEEDVERVAAARGWGDDVKFLARQTRSGGVEFPTRDPKREITLSSFVVELKENAQILAAKKAAKERFHTQYPRPEAPSPAAAAAPAYLSHNFTGQPSPTVAQPHSPVLRSLTGGANGGTPVVGQPALPDAPGQGDPLANVDWDQVPGPNLVAKCEHLIRADYKAKGQASPDYDTVNSQAVMMARSVRPRLRAVR